MRAAGDRPSVKKGGGEGAGLRAAGSRFMCKSPTVTWAAPRYRSAVQAGEVGMG